MKKTIPFTNQTVEKHIDNKTTLCEYVTIMLEKYFANLDDNEPSNLYNIVLEQVEKPLLEKVLEYTGNNQCRSAKILSISRGTLRKKLQQYNVCKNKD